MANTVVNGINKLPANVATNGEGQAAGEELDITITFTSPLILPPGNYFFRPEVLLTSGDFLFLSVPRPICAARKFVGRGSTDRDPQLQTHTGLAANWYGYHRRRCTANV